MKDSRASTATPLARTTLACVCALFALQAPVRAQHTTTYRWAGELESSTGVITPLNAKGEPDPNVATFESAFFAPEATYRDFGIQSGVFSYTTTTTCALAVFLGVSEDDVKKADFIAFEFNGLVGGPSFESSTWDFDDGCNRALVSHVFPDVGDAGSVIAVGNLSIAAYESLFGTAPQDASLTVAALLFDLPFLEVQCPDFRVTVRAPGLGTGSPDIDAMAVLPGDGFPFCAGSPCSTCSNNGAPGRGCDNSLLGEGGASLSGRGVAEFGATDTFGALVCGLPGGPGVLLKGSSLLGGGTGNLVGDGRLCVAPELRSQVQFPDAWGRVNMTDWRGQKFGTFPGAANPVFTSTYYQYYYRDTLNCSGLNFNFSNAWEVTWKTDSACF